MLEVDILVAEIGSTTTVVSAFTGLPGAQLRVCAQGQAATTVLEGDVTIGLQNAIAAAETEIGQTLNWSEFYASSSAAGGLKMTVHGLAYDMTVKAGREAALGAGANIHWVTAGELSEEDIASIEAIKPNMILLAGGVDYGEKQTVIANATKLSRLCRKIPIVYAGNIAAQLPVRRIFEEQGFSVQCVDNVYPRIDTLNIEPTRRAIQEVFERHIIEAPGMQKIRQLVGGLIVPTPGAVMRAAQLLHERIGDLLVVDVGGATTDVHSVTEGDAEIARILIAPEPLAKRTVEGDLGVYINAGNLLRLCDKGEISRQLGVSEKQLLELCVPIPQSDRQRELIRHLTEAAVKTAVGRHAGNIEHLYSPVGRIDVARGKDLTQVKWIIGTGGALTRLPAGEAILKAINMPQNSSRLMPRHAEALIDRDYIMAAAGLLAHIHPKAALNLMCDSLGISHRGAG